MLSTEVGERADFSPKADTPPPTDNQWARAFIDKGGFHADRVSSGSLLEVGHVVIVLGTISLQ